MRETRHTSVAAYEAGAWVDTYVQGTYEPENRYKRAARSCTQYPGFLESDTRCTSTCFHKNSGHPRFCVSGDVWRGVDLLALTLAGPVDRMPSTSASLRQTGAPPPGVGRRRWGRLHHEPLNPQKTSHVLGVGRCSRGARRCGRACLWKASIQRNYCGCRRHPAGAPHVE